MPDMSGSAGAAAAAAGGRLAGSDAGKHDRTRPSKVHDELWSRCGRVKPVIVSLKRRLKGLGTSHLTLLAIA